MLLDELKQSIRESEALKLTVYKCPAGVWSIGYGRNLEHVGVSKNEAEILLENDLLDIKLSVEDKFNWFKDLNDIRQNVIVEMVYNMGLGNFSKFKNTITYIKNKEYEKASKEMLNSKWHTDFIKYAPNTKVELLRSSRLTKIFKEGIY